MTELTEDGQRRVAAIAARHGFAPETAELLLGALRRGGGSQAQFNAPELGGMGQWSRGGMLMIGDMFNNALKARVDAICNELAGLVGSPDLFRAVAPGGMAGGDWPAELGAASSSGSQNDMRYAVFPGSRRLAVARGGIVTIYDTGDHAIGGVSQAQSDDQTLAFSSQLGPVRLSELRVVSTPAVPVMENAVETAAEPPAKPTAPAPAVPTPALPASVIERAAAPLEGPAGDPVGLIERLAELHARGILTDEEFSRKKSELLSRL